MGADNVRPGAPTTDIGRFDLGTPLAVVTPGTEDEAAAVVAWCASQRIGVVPVGRRTAYWHPLHLDGTVALDLRRLDTITWSGLVRCGAGTAVRPLDVALRGRGFHLPLHPDAFGDTSVGAMVASACTSGIGMGQGAIGRWVAGLRVIDGEGRIFRTGSDAIGAPLLRDGLPDLTGLLLGAEGGLGVVTAIDLALVPAPWRVRLRFAAPAAAGSEVAALGRSLAGLYDTFRVIRGAEPPRAPGGWDADLWIQSPLSAEEARARADVVAARIRDTLAVTVTIAPETETARQGRSPAYDERWQGPSAGHRAFAERAALIGLDVNAPYEAAPSLLRIAEAQLAEAVAHPVPQARIALYLAPGFVNLGLHVSCAHTDREWGHAHQQRWLTALAELSVVPYRLGRTWPAALLTRDPVARAHLLAIKRALDPHGILHPGQPLFG